MHQEYHSPSYTAYTKQQIEYIQKSTGPKLVSEQVAWIDGKL